MVRRRVNCYTLTARDLWIQIQLAITFVCVGHHLFKILEVDIAVSIGVDGSYHVVTVFMGAHPDEAFEHVLKLYGGDQAFLILVIETEGIPELGGATTILGARAAKSHKLGEGEEAVIVWIELH